MLDVPVDRTDTVDDEARLVPRIAPAKLHLSLVGGGPVGLDVPAGVTRGPMPR